jgi:sterol desaturase/sphingolipid hydroxylase (fatty acid hydroxylase superfamily)
MSAHEYFTSVAVVLSVMAAVALLEAAVPLLARPRTPPGRRKVNLAMTAQTLLVAFVLTSAVAVAAVSLPLASPALMAALGLPAVAQLVVGVVALDFAYGYAAHRTMHASPALWKYHRVHHSDAFVDVTTSYRTHPVEIAWRYLWLFATLWALGVPAVALVAFSVLSAVNGILEHANIRVPPALDTALSRVWVTPNMHKVHHSRDQAETDSNYGTLLTIHDRVFGTFLPTVRAFSVTYGLDDVDPAETGSIGALLAMPWRSQPDDAARLGSLARSRLAPNPSTPLSD